MALYYRSGVTLTARLSNLYCNKFLGCLMNMSTQKFTIPKKTVKEKDLQNSRFKRNPSDKSTDNLKIKDLSSEYIEVEEPSQCKTFNQMLMYRKDQARRSIIVQVQGPHIYESLKQYCSGYGKIKNMLHYQKGYSQHFFIVEFETQDAVSNILTSAMFADKETPIPVKSTMLWYRHQSNARQKLNQKQDMFVSTVLNDDQLLERDIATILRSSDRISNQISELYDTLKLNEIDIRLRFYITFLIENCFKGILPYSSIKPFGSSVNGFGMRNCDLDLAFLVPQGKSETKSSNLMYMRNTHVDAKQDVKYFLSAVSATISYFIPGISDVHKILEARVPIIKFKHDYTATDCDLSATNESGVTMSEVLWACGELNPNLRPLVCTIRKWAEAHKLTNESPGRWVSNFSLSLLVLFYLQQKDMLPPIKKLKTFTAQDDRATQEKPDIFITRELVQRFSKNKNMSLAELLVGFFDYYIKFDFEKYALSVLEGKIVRKNDVASLYICNPFEIHMNVSKNVNQFELQRIKLAMQDALQMFEKEIDIERCNLMFLLNMTCLTTNAVKRTTIRESMSESEKLKNPIKTEMQQRYN